MGSKQSLQEIMKLIEQNAEKKTKEFLLSDHGKNMKDINFENKLKEIMQEGETEFIKKTGRRMTYVEMREIFG